MKTNQILMFLPHRKSSLSKLALSRLKNFAPCPKPAFLCSNVRKTISVAWNKNLRQQCIPTNTNEYPIDYDADYTLATGIPIYAWVWDDQSARPQKGENPNPERELLWGRAPVQLHKTNQASHKKPKRGEPQWKIAMKQLENAAFVERKLKTTGFTGFPRNKALYIMCSPLAPFAISVARRYGKFAFPGRSPAAAGPNHEMAP